MPSALTTASLSSCSWRSSVQENFLHSVCELFVVFQPQARLKSSTLRSSALTGCRCCCRCRGSGWSRRRAGAEAFQDGPLRRHCGSSCVTMSAAEHSWEISSARSFMMSIDHCTSFSLPSMRHLQPEWGFPNVLAPLQPSARDSTHS